jgi:hypothetical protein
MSDRTMKNQVRLQNLHHQKVQSRHTSRAWLHEVLAPGFFIVCLGILASVIVHAATRPGQTTKKVAAKEPVHLVTLSRTPVFRADGEKFAVLGLGQDARSGRQLVWIKHIGTNKIKGYREGQALFGSAVTVARISDRKVDINNLGVRIPVVLSE